MNHLGLWEPLIRRKRNAGDRSSRRSSRSCKPPEESKLGYASYLLVGDAEYWWRGARLMLEANHEEVNWHSFKIVFLEKYFPVSAQEAKETQFLTLKQGTMSVAEYASKLESLAKHFRFFKGQVD